MTGDSWRERRRALLRDDPGETERAARLLDRLDTENRDDEEIEAEHRASRLAAAQEYAPRARLDEELQLRETKERDQEIIFSGRITELRESGLVKVKTGTAENAPAYNVRFDEPEELLRMRPGLGDNAHFRVRFRQQLDSMGIARSTECTYLGPAAEQTSLPLGLQARSSCRAAARNGPAGALCAAEGVRARPRIRLGL
ncbi:hypothetical protein DIZ27_29380 [Streptomyces sp. NWU339]|uniref:hypothetical protein n=1 Tax=Streptomyces sp. NWU339 TaxID=2185284 RepID=UPI000D684E14|nr:hypothetical protein [Streptomyces sp. NWU339]PWI07213.1 hypothetical protein DIZ27_29380 [Streptomyces sp. NWU339]